MVEQKFRGRLGFKQYEVINNKKKKSVLTKIISSLAKGNMQIQYNFLSYRIDLYFHDYQLAIEIDENRHSDRNIDSEIKRKKSVEQELCCKIIAIDSDKED